MAMFLYSIFKIQGQTAGVNAVNSEAATSGFARELARSVNRRRWIIWSCVLLFVTCAVGGFIGIRKLVWATPLELEIAGDLRLSGNIDDNTRVSVLEELSLYSFYSRFGPQRIATLCIQRPDGQLQLAYAKCWRDGMMWHTDSKRWKLLDSWPNAAVTQAFQAENADVVDSILAAGYLPRPPGTEGFQLTHASIQMSDNAQGFDPAKDVDPRHLAIVLKSGLHLGPYAFAPFHNPQWHLPAEGVQSVEAALEYLHLISGEAEGKSLDCESLIRTLQAVRKHLLRAEQLGLKFYLLAEDRTEKTPAL